MLSEILKIASEIEQNSNEVRTIVGDLTKAPKLSPQLSMRSAPAC